MLNGVAGIGPGREKQKRYPSKKERYPFIPLRVTQAR